MAAELVVVVGFTTTVWVPVPPTPPNVIVWLAVPATAVPIFIVWAEVVVFPIPMEVEELKIVEAPVAELAILTVPEVIPVLKRAKFPVVTDVVMVGEFNRVVEAPVPPKVRDTVGAVKA